MKKAALLLSLLFICPFVYAAARDFRISDNDGDVLNINSDGTIPVTGAGGVASGCLEFGTADGGNDETICNDTDDFIVLQGAGGSDNTDLRIDLDGTGPVIDSSTDSLITFIDQVEVSNSTFPVVRVTRESAVTNLSRSAFEVVHKSSGNVIDGFASAFSFSISDTGVSNSIIGQVEATRAGADNTGTIDIKPYSAGSPVTAATFGSSSITLDLSTTVDGTLTIEGSTNNCILTVDADGTCDTGTSIGSDSSIAICAVCAAN